MSGGVDWSKDEDLILANRYSEIHTSLLSKDMNRTISGIHHRANRLGLKKSKKFYDNLSRTNSVRIKINNPSIGGLSKIHKKKIGCGGKIVRRKKENIGRYYKFPAGKDNPSKRPSVRIKHRNNAIKQWSDKKSRDKILDGLNLKPNKPEKILIKIMREINSGFKYVGDGKYWISDGDCNFNPDFILLKKKKIIEFFGDYWHNIPKNKRRDVKRIVAYKKRGFNTLVIWEHELKNVSDVVFRIKNFMKNDSPTR